MDAFYLFIGLGFFALCMLVVEHAFTRVKP
jgi:hypothetical protein